jgi:hypothetical protein
MIKNTQEKIIYRVLLIETIDDIERTMMFYGNSTNPGGHILLNGFLIYLSHSPASNYIKVISQILSQYSSDRWPNWTVSININLLCIKFTLLIVFS